MQLKNWIISNVSLRVSVSGLIVLLMFLMVGSVFSEINDPVAYWSFDDESSLLANQVTSSQYHDASILFGLPSSGIVDGADGVAGNALMLDGTSAIRLPYNQDNLSSSFTLSLWYWQLTNDTRQCVYQTRDNYTATYEAMDGANANFASYVGQTFANYITIDPHEWINLVQVFSNANDTVTLSVYTNGAFVFSKSVSSHSMFNANQVRGFHVGAYRLATGPADGRCFKGMIDEMAFWARPLSSNEVSAVYQRGVGGQKLEFTPHALPSISLGGELSFLLNMDDGIPDGMFNNAWLLNDVQDPIDQTILLDTAGDMLDYVPDTAGSVDGPFNAQVSDDGIKWQVPLTTAMRQLSQTNFTVETWFRTTATESRQVLMGSFYNNANGIINLELFGTNNVRFYQGNVSGTTTDLNLSVTNATTRDGLWHHLAGVRTNNMMILYLDGEKVGSTITATGFYALQGNNFYLGRDIRTGIYPFTGEQGHIRFWTRALSTNELASIAALKLPGSSDISQSGLLAEYALYNPYNAGKSDPWYRFAANSPQLKQLPMADFSCDAVFRTTATGPKVLLGNYHSSTSNGVVNLMLENDGGVRLYLKNGVGTVDSIWPSPGSIDTRDGEWHHLVGVREGTTMSLYLDGEKQGSTEAVGGAYILDSDYYYIGKDRRNTWGVFDGDIAHARIWSRALSTDEVAGLAVSNSVPVDGLVAQYTPTLLNNLHTSGFPGSRFLRTFTTATNTSTLLFTDLPRHNKISLGMLLAQLDALDPVADNDHFEIRIDGSEVLSVGLGPDTGSEVQVNAFELFGETKDVQIFKDTMTAGGEELFICSTSSSVNDHVYDLASLEALQAIPHTGSTLTLELVGIHNAGGENESFGIDQIQLTVIPPLGTLILIY
jgi:hypothetical protein